MDRNKLLDKNIENIQKGIIKNDTIRNKMEVKNTVLDTVEKKILVSRKTSA